MIVNIPKGRNLKSISIAATYSSIYVTLTLPFGSLGYGLINLRFANAMLGMVPIVGWPAIMGQTVGVLITSSLSPLGPLDLVNALPAFFFSWILWKLRYHSVMLGLSLYSLALGFTVTETIHYISGAGLEVTLPYVVTGIFLTTGVGGYVLYRSIRRSKSLTLLLSNTETNNAILLHLH